MANEGIIDVILGRRETEPRIIHREANLVWSLLEQFWVVLHHALKASRCFKLGTLGVGVLGVDVFWDYTTACLKGFDIIRDFEHQRVRITRERRVP